MVEYVLVDSIDFGIRESELVHDGGGSFACEHDDIRTQYRGPSFFSQEDYALHSWRDWGDLISFDLTVPDSYRDFPLVFTFTIKPYIHGEPSRALEAMTVTIESDDGELFSGKADIQFNLDGLWLIAQTQLPPGLVGSSGLFRVTLDNRVNIHSDGSHFGKTIASARLLARLGKAEEAL